MIGKTFVYTGLLGAACLAGIAACQSPETDVPAQLGSAEQSEKSALAGVWDFTESHARMPHRETGDMIERTTPAGNPRRFMFTDGHYSYFEIAGDEPRPLRANAGEGKMGGPKVPRDQKLAEYNPLNVEMGTYEIDGEIVYLKPDLDHLPDNMLGNGRGNSERTFKIDGDILTTRREAGGGAIITETFTRIE